MRHERNSEKTFREAIRNVTTATVAICLVNGATPAAADKTQNIERAGDILQLAIPLAAFGATYLKGDKEGRIQFLKGVGTTFLTVQTLKAAVDKWRPNFSDEHSFPSGHTAAAFSGAAFFGTRYGWRYGVPAYALAAFVGYSRIRAENHYSDDVLAGASIAMLSNWLYASPLENGVRVVPTVSQDRVGLNLTMPTRVTKDAQSTFTEPFNPRFRFAFSFGATSLDNNDVTAPSATGTKLDLETFDSFSSPTTSSGVTFEYFMSDRHEFIAVINPLEVRDQGSFTTPVNFNGTIYPAGVQTNMDWVMNEIRGAYLYNLVRDGSFKLKIGAGITMQSTDIRLVSDTLDQTVKSRDFAPYAVLQASYDFSDRWHLDFSLDGTSFESVEFTDAVLSLRYDVTQQWDIGFGVQQYSRKLEVPELTNDYQASSAFVTIGYSF